MRDALLDRLRPDESLHERLLILPPAMADDDGDPERIQVPTYADYAAAEWVRAATRPDLDPVMQRRVDPAGGRALASPMSVFGLATPDRTGAPGRFASAPAVAPTDALHNAKDAEHAGSVDPFAGYGASTSAEPLALQVGDLVCVDEDAELWATVDQPPEEDYADSGCVAVSWRSDDDEAGCLSVPANAAVPVGRPVQYADSE